MQVKFRAKTKDHNRWVIGDLHHVDGEQYVFPHDPNELNSPDHYVIQPETLGMFTGLHDRKGNEIYGGIGPRGGDIVRLWDYEHPLSNRIETEVYWCEWCKESCGFGLTNNDLLEDIAPHFGLHFGWHQVIGTVIDNPELLGQ